ncbi:predicted protein, partial [Nematostella vectensis]
VFITTKNNEKYQCILPAEQIKQKPYQGEYGPGPDPADLLSTLADSAKCSYRLEAYWTYELCHGKHVRQFHDERSQKIPTRKVEGRDMRYYEVVMGNGTPCDLKGHTPREVHILYLCHPQSHNEIMSVKEISTCVYEIEVLTPVLCSNELYKFQEDPVHRINCHSLPGSPDEPLSYTELVEEQRIEQSGQKEVNTDPPEDRPKAHKDFSPASQPPTQHDMPPAEFQTKIRTPKPDEQLTRDFLRGDYCLQGGTGWWKYELCYGKRVIQFHVDQDHGGRTDILLGTWDKQKHVEWVAKRSSKSIKLGYTVHLYTGGDMCDLTGRPRQVQVRLKCKESSHLQEVSLYLMEPNVCEYILGVESPIICPLLDKVDEHGLFPPID